MGVRLIKRLLPILATVLLFILLFTQTVVADNPSGDPDTVWESYTTNDDANYEAFGNAWYSQTFTVNSESHSVASIRLLVYREGSPGTVTVSIKAVNATGQPVGDDLTSGTFDGDIITDAVGGGWYSVTLTEYSLEYGETYGIVIRAEAGDNANSLHIRYDGSAGTYAGGSEQTTVTGGVTWIEDTDDDAMFQILGTNLLDMYDANVFRGYNETNDMLFTCAYYNTYVPYYPNGEPADTFWVQLRSQNGTTVLAQTTCMAWGYKPAAIYLNANQASSLNPGAAYILSIYGNVAEAPIYNYTLTSADWRGDNLDLLDLWVLSTARALADWYDVDMTTFASGSELLNEQGGIIFALGIPGLQYARPELFQTRVYIPEYDAKEGTHAFETETTWNEQVGADTATAISGIANIFGIDGRNLGAFAVVAIYIIVCLAVVAKGGDALVAALLGIPIIALGTWLRFLDIAFISIVIGIAVLMTMYRLWWART